MPKARIASTAEVLEPVLTRKLAAEDVLELDPEGEVDVAVGVNDPEDVAVPLSRIALR